MKKYTIRLGSRQWECTDFHNTWRFIFAFPSDKSEAFNLTSAPYSGKEINTVVNVKQ